MWANVLTRFKVAISQHISIVRLRVCVSVCTQTQWSHRSLVWAFMWKPQCFNHHIFVRVAPNCQDCTGEDEKSPVNFKIRHTPCEPRPQAKPFEGPHSAGSLWNVDKRATVKLLLSDHIASLTSKQWRSDQWSAQTNFAPTWHEPVSVPPLEITDRCRPVVFTEEEHS